MDNTTIGQIIAVMVGLTIIIGFSELKQTLVKSQSDQKTLNLIKLSNNNLGSERRL